MIVILVHVLALLLFLAGCVLALTYGRPHEMWVTEESLGGPGTNVDFYVETHNGKLLAFYNTMRGEHDREPADLRDFRFNWPARAKSGRWVEDDRPIILALEIDDSLQQIGSRSQGTGMPLLPEWPPSLYTWREVRTTAEGLWAMSLAVAAMLWLIAPVRRFWFAAWRRLRGQRHAAGFEPVMETPS